MPVSAPDGSAVLERGRPADSAPPADPGAPPVKEPARAPTSPARDGSARTNGAARSSRRSATESAAKSPAAKEAPAPGRSVLEEEPAARRSLVEILGVWGFAVLVHVVVLLGLSFIVIDSEVREQIFSILGKPSEEPDDAPIWEAIEMPESLDKVEETTEIAEVVSDNVAEEAAEMPMDVNELDPSLALDAAEVGPAIDVNLSDATSGRSAAAKAALVQKYGGNQASEKAVATGLKWIASHQRADGSWNFNDIGDPETFDKEGKPEGRDAPTGATAAALLAFLGAGHTHQDPGPYKVNVEKGLAYLLANARVGTQGGDFRGGVDKNGMYIQGLAGIALAEAYGMTKDRRLRLAAETGALFIVNAQSPLDGGWRYIPAFERKTPEPSDTSVVGWQLMALKSAQAANIKINRRVFLGVSSFLDAASHNDGAEYGYKTRASYGAGSDGAGSVTPARSAVGLLCRMYLGWDEDDERLARGVELLAKRGPERNDSYYAYYATQVLHHWGGEKWEEWNAVQRDYLVTTQEQSGPKAGSWNPGNSHNDKGGGRLWVTCLSVMTLEVYYRHLPLYERGSIKVDL